MNAAQRTVRLFFAILGFAAIVAQFAEGITRADFIVLNFFSYFTIQSNILIALVLLAGAVVPGHVFQSVKFQLLRGAATAFIMTTGVVYFLFLRGLEESLQTPVPWVNTTLHYILPLIALIDWVWAFSKVKIAFKHTLIWLSYPLIYLIYTLVRGPFADWYPYPFVDPRPEGYIPVIISSLFLTLLIFTIAMLVMLIRNMRFRKSKRHFSPEKLREAK
ncbi:Pr6Pr family membrane protein [Jeotgalibacillus aurantiacus]|uniref:Pr6Pr family membrane protein n=1 Tax=Jeotgalibacillus aurantiacus TaxID=2763266 RepID=UPI001D0A995E|nr:Pr6Pr family membrane protein [Jeotgalibacillus aurantiacus]